jgi:hypothetical protein
MTKYIRVGWCSLAFALNFISFVSSSKFDDVFYHGGGMQCSTITFVGLPSTHPSSLISALKEVIETDTSKSIELITPTMKDILFKGSDIEGGPCTLVLYRDFRQVLCTMARHHGDCRRCSSTAMEAKIKHWTLRLFGEVGDKLSWGEWLPQLKSRGSVMMKYECLDGVTTFDLQNRFRSWLGLEPVGMSSNEDLVITSLYDGWQSCFTENSFKVVHDTIEGLSREFGYDSSLWGDATCGTHMFHVSKNKEHSPTFLVIVSHVRLCVLCKHLFF